MIPKSGNCGKKEYVALITYIKLNKANDNDWFRIESNKMGTFGKGNAGTTTKT